MILTIEVTEADIRDVVERKIKSAIHREIEHGNVDAYITEQVKAHWAGIIDCTVARVMVDADAIRDQVVADVEKKTTARVRSAIRKALTK